MTLDVRDTAELMIPQYEGSKAKSTATGVLAVMQKMLVEPVSELLYTLDDQYGFMLDEVGARLGFPRPEVPGDLEFWGAAPEDVGFSRGVLASSSNPVPPHLPGAPAGDDQYRRMLKARGVYLRSTGGTRAEVAAAAEQLVGAGRYVIYDLQRQPTPLGNIYAMFGWDGNSVLSGMCRVGSELRMVSATGEVASFDPLTHEITHYPNFDVPGNPDKIGLAHSRGFMWVSLAQNGALRRFPWPEQTTDDFVFLGYQNVSGLQHARGVSGPLSIGDALYFVNVERLYRATLTIDESRVLPQDTWRIAIDSYFDYGAPTDMHAAATDGRRLWTGRYSPTEPPAVFDIDLSTGEATTSIAVDALPDDSGIYAMAYFGNALYAAVYTATSDRVSASVSRSGQLWRIPLETSGDYTHFELVLTGLDARYFAMISENSDKLIPRSPGVEMTLSAQVS